MTEKEFAARGAGRLSLNQAEYLNLSRRIEPVTVCTTRQAAEDFEHRQVRREARDRFG